MKRKLLAILITVILLSTLLPLATQAAGPPPATIPPPQNIGAWDQMGSTVIVTMSAPDDLRAILAQSMEERGYDMAVYAQIDFKIDNGNWHYASDWDDSATYVKYASSYRGSGGQWLQYIAHNDLMFNVMFPNETDAPVRDGFSSYNWYKSHAITFRARFAVDFYNNSIIFSDWSSEYVLSDKVKMDYKKIMSANAPTLVSAMLEQNSTDKRPYVWVSMGRHPANTEKMNAAAGDSIRTEIWLRKEGDTEFKLVGDARFAQEKLYLDVSAYYTDGKITDYAAAAYEVKARYKIDEGAYPQSGGTTGSWIYGPYSNTLSYGMPTWSAASKWATGELKKADDYGLIPDILKGADLTKPITREEFAKMAMLLYEKTTGKKAVAAAKNPFTDTKDPEILKAFELGITTGVSTTKFAPKDLIPRQQVATMLSRAVRAIVPDGDFSTDGAPVFSDEKDIDSWAKEHVKFMSKIGVIGGTNGKFMPKATTTAQQAAGYGTATREQSLAMDVRIYEKYK